jgi:hypothetical protein
LNFFAVAQGLERAGLIPGLHPSLGSVGDYYYLDAEETSAQERNPPNKKRGGIMYCIMMQ